VLVWGLLQGEVLELEEALVLVLELQLGEPEPARELAAVLAVEA
jgi:hypothetical protein